MKTRNENKEIQEKTSKQQPQSEPAYLNPTATTREKISRGLTDTGARLQQHSGQFSGVNIFRAGNSSNQSHTIGHRTYLYYPSANDGTELHWACPRLYRIDGSQPSAAELISGEMNAAAAGMS